MIIKSANTGRGKSVAMQMPAAPHCRGYRTGKHTLRLSLILKVVFGIGSTAHSKGDRKFLTVLSQEKRLNYFL